MQNKINLNVFFCTNSAKLKMEMSIEQLFNDTRADVARVFGSTFELLYKMYLDNKCAGRFNSFSLDTWFKTTNITKCNKIYKKTLLMCLMFALYLYDNDYSATETKPEAKLVVAKYLLKMINEFAKDDPHIYVHTRTILEKYIENFGT